MAHHFRVGLFPSYYVAEGFINKKSHISFNSLLEVSYNLCKFLVRFGFSNWWLLLWWFFFVDRGPPHRGVCRGFIAASILKSVVCTLVCWYENLSGKINRKYNILKILSLRNIRLMINLMNTYRSKC